MKRSIIMNLRIKPIVAACMLAMAAGQAGAVDYYLAAKPYNKVLMPGTPMETSVPMWGYVFDPDVAGDLDGDGDPNGPEGDCFETTPIAARLACINNLAAPTGVVGPRLTIQPTDPTLRIFLSNGLPEPTSIVIPGQEMPHSALNNGVPDNGPTWNDGSRGSRGGDFTKKLRSYGREANPNGGRRAFVWANWRNNPITETGTLIYHTGTWPQKQLYMGLYGVVTKDAGPGLVYDLDPGTPGDEVAYSSDHTLFYSDIDPDFNRAVVSGYDQTPYAPNDYSLSHSPLQTAIERHPSWFLINGEPYVPGATPDITGFATNQPNLIRFASAATENHVAVMQGLYGTIHGEDGIQYTWQDGVTGAEAPAPVQQYSVGIPPLKTKDVIINPIVADRYAIYDGNGYMTNPSDPANEAAGDTLGGMLRFINIAQGANQPPVTLADQVEITIPEVSAGPVAVDVDVLANDFDPEGVALGVLDSVAQFTGTNITVDWTCSATTNNCSATATATDPWTSPVSADLTYTATDFNAATADTVGSVTVNVVQNMAPVPADDTLAAVTDAPLNFNLYTDLVLPNDTDAENDTLAVTSVDVNAATDLDAGVVSCPDLVVGDCTYTPPNPLPATIPFDKTFTYTVSDGVNPDSAPVTVTITADLPGDPAIANDDPYATDEDTILNVPALTGVLANDTDSALAPLAGTETAVLVAGSGPSNAANFIFNSDGSFDYEPAVDFNGADSFQYVVNNGVDSLPATVTITVNPVADPPVAVADGFVTGQSTLLDEAAPGVLANDSDPDGDTLSAVLVSGPSCAWTAGPSGVNAFVLNPDGSFHYEPVPGWNSTMPASNTLCPGVTGDDSFTYMANDGVNDSTAVTVTITVNPQTAPVATNDIFILTAPTDTVLTIEGELVNTVYVIAAPGVLANDTYVPDNTATPPQTLTELNDPDNLTPSLANDGSVTFELDNLATGIIATLEYEITDATGATSNPATVDLIRHIAVKKSEYNLREDSDPTNNDWRISGEVDPTVIPVGSVIFAYIIRENDAANPVPINTPADINPINDMGVVFGVNSWRVNIDNVGPRGDLNPNDRLRIEAHVDDGNGGIIIHTYDNVPIHVQN